MESYLVYFKFLYGYFWPKNKVSSTSAAKVNLPFLPPDREQQEVLVMAFLKSKMMFIMISYAQAI